MTLTGIDIPFGDMVKFMVKWALATIPAAIILLFLAVIFLAGIKALTNPFG